MKKKIILVLVFALTASCGSENNGGDTVDTETLDSATDTVDTDTGIATGSMWVSISGGTFDMGSIGTGADDDEQPVHSVTVPSFEMLKTEVTAAQYKECVTAGACTVPGIVASGYATYDYIGRENNPVNYVYRNQAVAFCAWIGGRLPTEAEWEYAARSGGKEQTYPWGDEEATCEYGVMYDGTASGCGIYTTWAVCSKTAGNTDQGLCDMAGNVWEWVEDNYHGSYDCDANSGAYNCGAGEVAPTDGSAWTDDPGGTYWVGRGGSFSTAAVYLRAAYRLRNVLSGQYFYLGFRCAR